MSELNLHKELKESLVLFGRAVTPQMYAVPSAAFHHELSKNLLDTNVPFLNIIAPRGHAKSSITACLKVLHHLVYEPGPHFIVLVSKTEGHAIRLLTTIKDVLNFSQTFRALYGYYGQNSAKKWDEKQVILKNNAMIMVRGTGQQVVGLKHINQRPTLIILDDPEDLENTKTIESMEKNLKWLLHSLVPARDPQRGRVIVVGTPQHSRSMVMMLEKMSQGENALWKTLRYKAIQNDGTALWPDWMPVEKLLKEKKALEEIGRVSVFYREYQCEVVGDEDQLFKEEFIQYYKGMLVIKNGLHFMQILKPTERLVPVNVFTGIDPASSIRDTADFSVIMDVAYSAQQERWVLPYFRARVTPMSLADNIIKNYDEKRSTKTRVESTGYQEMLRDYLKTKRSIPGLEIKEMPRHSKSVRLEGLEPIFRNKKIWLQEDMKALIDELLLYPRGDHDDCLDALYYACKNNFAPHHTAEQAKEPDQGKWLFEAQEPDEDELWITR